MKTFIHDDFLLDSEWAKKLYHGHAKDLPIIDYHNHLDAGMIAQNYQFRNFTEAWLGGDHYKWRAMRACGEPERLCSGHGGDASDEERFQAWARTVPKVLRNPLYHWTHLELSRYFGIDELLCEDNADSIFQEVSQQLQQKENGASGLLEQMKVEVVCTTDDPLDDLKGHFACSQNENCSIDVFPTFRPDRAVQIGNGDVFRGWVEQLGKISGIKISNYVDFLEALKGRHHFFHQNGCRLSDHALARVPAKSGTPEELNTIYNKAIQSVSLTETEIETFEASVLLEIAKWNHAQGWTQQYHVGALRNVNTRIFHAMGADVGCDSAGGGEHVERLGWLLDQQEKEGQLPQTILYHLNAKDDMGFAAMAGNFFESGVRGKVQYGAAWWFLDQLDGMERQLNLLSSVGVLSTFVGMLTDSRSFLSFPRHEYFRRLVCRIFGRDIESGLLPADEILIGQIVSDLSYGNARRYFRF